MGTIPIHIDLGAEKTMRKAIEIKTFGNSSFITAMYEALGKYIIYRKALAVLSPERLFYLAIPDDIYTYGRKPSLKLFN